VRGRTVPAVPTLALLAVAGFSSLVSMRLCDAMLPALAAAFGATPTEAATTVSYFALHNTLQVNATQLSTTSRGLAVSIFASCLFLGQSAGVPAAAHAFARYEPAWGFGIAGAALTVLGLIFADQLQRRHARSAAA